MTTESREQRRSDLLAVKADLEGRAIPPGSGKAWTVRLSKGKLYLTRAPERDKLLEPEAGGGSES